VYGDLLNLHNGDKYIVNNKFGACIDDKGNFINTESPFVCKVIPETVGRYTGITDKNGKKIFEHNIVKVTICSSYDCYVCFKDYAWYFVPLDEKVKEVKFGVLKHADYEVIGTVFDKESDNDG
jgi:uncharacterized phage protein (TIGR01671 family)